MTDLTFKTDDEVVVRARQILAGRAYIPATAKVLMDDEKKLREYLAMDMAGYDVERFKAYYFSPDGKLLKDQLIALGDEKSVCPAAREVARQGLLCNATFVGVAHNHPNGDSEPSKEDQTAMESMAKVLGAVDLRLVFACVVAGPDSKDVVGIQPPKSEYRPESNIDELLRFIGR